MTHCKVNKEKLDRKFIEKLKIPDHRIKELQSLWENNSQTQK